MIIALSPPARAEITTGDAARFDAGGAARSLPPAIVVRLRPESVRPTRFAPRERAAASAQIAELRSGYARISRPDLSPGARAMEVSRAMDALGLRALPDLGTRAVRHGALALVSPYAGLEGTVERFERTYRLIFDANADAEAIAADLAGAAEVEEAFVEPVGHLLAVPSGSDRDASLAPMNADIVPPNDPLFVSHDQWGLRNTGTGMFGGVNGNDIRAIGAWGITTGNSSVTIGIVDTGVDFGHPELDHVLTDGSHRVSAYNGTNNGPPDEIADSLGHGTMVAGIAAALTWNGAQLDGRGVAGVCGGSGGDSVGCRIVSERVTLGSFNDAFLMDIVSGIIKAWQRGARAINVSFGFPLSSPYGGTDILYAIGYVQEHGATVVCGGGNGQDETFQYPGAFAQFGNGVSVGGLTSSATSPVWSSRGSQIDVVAPGEGIWSTWPRYANHYAQPDRNFEYSSGTSFSAPFVTGMAALAVSLQPTLTDNEFQYFVRNSAHDLGTPGRDDTFGYGRVDAWQLMMDLEGRVFRRGVADAQSWSLVGRDTVNFFGSNLYRNGCAIAGTHIVDRWEVRAHVDLPCLSYEGPRVVVRTHGTTGWPGGKLLGFDLGGGEVVPGSVTNQSFDVRSYVYDIKDAPSWCSNQSPQGFVPSPPANVKIAWSALAVMDTTILVAPGGGGLDTIPWDPNLPEFARVRAVSPNPARGPVTFRFSIPESGRDDANAATLEIYDIAGREVRAITVAHQPGGLRELVWNLNDAKGLPVKDGLYLARIRTGSKVTSARRVVVLGR